MRIHVTKKKTAVEDFHIKLKQPTKYLELNFVLKTGVNRTKRFG